MKNSIETLIETYLHRYFLACHHNPHFCNFCISLVSFSIQIPYTSLLYMWYAIKTTVNKFFSSYLRLILPTNRNDILIAIIVHCLILFCIFFFKQKFYCRAVKYNSTVLRKLFFRSNNKKFVEDIMDNTLMRDTLYKLLILVQLSNLSQISDEKKSSFTDFIIFL